ncbi:hypothetical protein H072_9411 [Dactylellina haptotyla CBS 200.50]|uniref:Uncharacterized protein n=1 Tax=Dactylellina haptotyla (strain CBS 200.50) TaxID=1284197 RepID=S8A784_DACHA|nr:hypothetical protein H072_9411 [Dactylellina haptotyla CBS 200.50]
MMRQIFLILGLMPLLLLAVAVPAPSTEDDFFNGVDLPQDYDPYNMTQQLAMSDEQVAAIKAQYGIEDDDKSSTSDLSKRDTVNLLGYSITLNGVNRGNVQNFIISGSLFLLPRINSVGTRNGNNAAEFVLYVGDPYANPQAGAIRYYTNRYLYRLSSAKWGASRVDFSYVTKSGNTFTIRPDYSLAASNPLSAFNQKGGVTASIFLVDVGAITITLSKDWKTVSGTIAVDGRGYLFPDTRGWHRATFTGRLGVSQQVTF